MELLKRACMDGVEPTKALVLRITDDCCNEKAFFNRQVEVERQKLQEGDGAEAAPEPAPKGKALLGGKRFQEAAEKPAESHIKAAPVKAQAKAERAKPKPAAEPAFKQTPNRQRTAKARASLQEPDIPDFVLAPGQRKGEAQDQASAGTVLLVMFLSLVIVLGVVAWYWPWLEAAYCLTPAGIGTDGHLVQYPYFPHVLAWGRPWNKAAASYGYSLKFYILFFFRVCYNYNNRCRIPCFPFERRLVQ